MMNRILLITGETGVLRESLVSLEKRNKVYYSKGIQDGITQITLFSYHLVFIAIQEDVKIICELVETVQKLTTTPIIVLLPLGVKERVLLLKAGAVIVLESPYESEELDLQVVALNRIQIAAKADYKNETDVDIMIGPLVISHSRRKVIWNGITIEVTKREFDFLYLLAAAPKRVYTYSQIYRIVWQEYPQDDITNLIWCLVYRLRKKLGKTNTKASKMIYSVKSTGYCLKLNSEQGDRF